MSLFKPQKYNCSAVIVAAGTSSRFGSDKLAAPLGGIPVLARTLYVFQKNKYISEIILVTESEKIMDLAQLCEDYRIHKVTKIVCGGETRLESALSGVSETSPESHFIAIHDGARPLVTDKVIEDAIKCAAKTRAAVPAIPSKDTVKLAKNKRVSATPDRFSVFNIQTPQVFLPEIIKGALTNALINNLVITDDAGAVELLGFPVFLSQGSEENIKITTPLDLMLAETILYCRKCDEEAAAKGQEAER